MTPVCPPVVCDAIGGAVGGAAKVAARDAAAVAFDAFVVWLATGAKWLLTQVVVLMDQTTKINLGAGWFLVHEKEMQKLGVLVVAPLLAAGVIGAIVRQDLSRLGRIVGFYLPVAVIGGVFAVELTQWALAVTDQLCGAVSQGLGPDARAALDRVLHGLAAMGSPVTDAGVVSAAASLLVIFGVLLIWLELVARSAAVYVAVLFLPMTLAGLVWPATARWARRIVELLAALVLSKFVIVAVVTLGAGALGQEDGIRDVLAGGALLLVAGFAPFTLLRLVPVVEAAAIGHLEGLSRRPAGAAVTAAALPSHPVVQQLKNREGGDVAGLVASLGEGQHTRVAAAQLATAGGGGGGRGGGGSGGGGSGSGGGEPPLSDGWWLRDAGWPPAAPGAAEERPLEH